MSDERKPLALLDALMKTYFSGKDFSPKELYNFILNAKIDLLELIDESQDEDIKAEAIKLSEDFERIIIDKKVRDLVKKDAEIADTIKNSIEATLEIIEENAEIDLNDLLDTKWNLVAAMKEFYKVSNKHKKNVDLEKEWNQA